MEKIKYNHGIDVYTQFKVGQIVNNLKIIDIGEYIVRIKSGYAPILRIQCLDCNNEMYVLENNFIQYIDYIKCPHKPPRPLTGEKFKIGDKYEDLEIIDFIYLFTISKNNCRYHKHPILKCHNCGINNILIKSANLPTVTHCGCKKYEIMSESHMDLKVGTLIKDWEITEILKTKINDKGTMKQIVKARCKCCGEEKISDKYTLTRKKCKKQQKERTEYIRKMREKLIYSDIPESVPNLIGLKCGMLEIVSFSFYEGASNWQGNRYWIVYCNICGQYSCKPERELVNQEVYSCGCIKSLGEFRISNFLMKNNINFKPQKWFLECRDIYPLPFDFYIEHPKTKEWFLLEYQGIQHFSERGFGLDKEKAKKKLKNQQKHDKMKYEYCLQNNIRLEYFECFDESSIEKQLCDLLEIEYTDDMLANSKEITQYYNRYKQIVKDTKKQKDEAFRIRRKYRNKGESCPNEALAHLDLI